MFDKRPALIAQCADVADVVAAVNFGREQRLDTAIRGGGHNGAGLGSVDNGLVIDLSLLKAVEVDPQARTARVAGGCVWGDVDRATGERGIGHLTRKCGLSIDNLLEAEVVLASGEQVRASAGENPDLYWALRGGGGNFGVVTSFVFRLRTRPPPRRPRPRAAFRAASVPRRPAST